MSTFNHSDAAIDGTTIDGADVTTADGQLDAAIGNLTTLSTTAQSSTVAAINEVLTKQGAIASLTTTDKSSTVAGINEVLSKQGAIASLLTTVKSSVVGAANELYTRLAGISNSDGTLKDGAVSTSAKLGAGVVTGGKLAAATLDTPNIVWAPDNVGPGPERHFNGRNRWYVASGRAEQALALVTNDAGNPYGLTYTTLRFNATSASTVAGKVIYMDEIGQTLGTLNLSFAVEWKATAGTYQIKAQQIDNTETAYGPVITSGVVTGDGSVYVTFLPPIALTSAPYGVRLYVSRVSGTSNFDIYNMWGTKGDYVTSSPPKRALSKSDGVSGRRGIVWDPTFTDILPSTDFGGRMRWNKPNLLTPIFNNANNPSGGTSIKATTAGVTAQTGKLIYLDETGLAIGDIVGFAALVTLDSPNARLRAAFLDSTNTTISTMDGVYVTSGSTLQMVYTPNAAIPANTVAISIFIELGTSGTPRNTEIHALWGGRDGIVDAWPMECPVPSFAREAQVKLSTIGKERLCDWRAFVSKYEGGSTVQADIVCLGDSWIEHGDLTAALRSNIQSLYGNAGGGYVDFSGTFAVGHSTAYWDFLSTTAGATQRNGTTTSTGTTTWTDTTRTNATARGVALMDMRAIDVTATAKFTFTLAFTTLRIYSYKVSGGGTFQYRIDGGSWTSVSTDNATAGVLTTTITGLSNATHVVEYQISVLGSAGVTLLGMDLRTTTNGVRVHKSGVSGSDVLNWTAVDATTWQNALAAIGANVVIIVLGTNDRDRTEFPRDFAIGLHTMVTRIRAAIPLADVILLAPAAGSVGVLPMQGYVAAMRGVAAQNTNCAFVSGSDALGVNADSTTRGLWADAYHLNADGMRILADLTTDVLKVR